MMMTTTLLEVASCPFVHFLCCVKIPPCVVRRQRRPTSTAANCSAILCCRRPMAVRALAALEDSLTRHAAAAVAEPQNSLEAAEYVKEAAAGRPSSTPRTTTPTPPLPAPFIQERILFLPFTQLSFFWSF